MPETRFDSLPHDATYQDLVTAAGLTILHSEQFGQYQGDILMAVKNPDGRHGVLVTGYGSCSGCDELEAILVGSWNWEADKWPAAELEKISVLAFQLVSEVHWGNREELAAKLTGEPSLLSWYGHEPEYKTSITDVLSFIPEGASA